MSGNCKGCNQTASFSQPVPDDSLSIRCQHTLWMELYSMHCIMTVAEGHYLSVIAHRCNLKTLRKAFSADHPTMITSHLDTSWQAIKQAIVCYNITWRSHTMIDMRQILNLCSKDFGYSLVAQTNSQDRQPAGIFSYHIKKKPCL